MGGDHAPEQVVKGTLQIAPELPDATLLLAGTEPAIRKYLPPNPPANIKIVPTTEVIGMSEHPVDAIRNKRNSSLVKAAKLVRDHEADAFISAGNTGAAVASATILWGFLSGIKRPGIAVRFPTKKGVSYIIDVGANIYCHPIHLLQYGIMTAVYCKYVNNIANPRVGLLNIGEEDSKGNELVQETLALYRKAPVNFIGNIEGQNLFNGDCEVVVCEGFVGNVILKATEGFADFFTSTIMDALKGLNGDAAGSAMNGLKPALDVLKKKTQYDEYGGAQLMGVNGICIISHGRSNAKAIANAIKVAAQSVKNHVNNEIVQELHKTKLTWLDLYKSWKTHR